jgi:osmotically-inducible protein OsmY
MVQTDPARDKPETAEDEQSIREIRALLASDRALAPISAQVTIAVRGGRVWLRGQVNTAGERAAIEKAARRAGGVLVVKNDLVVME